MMNIATDQKWNIERLKPFGAVIHSADPTRSPADVSLEYFERLVAAERVVVLRGFANLPGEAFPKFCSRFGEILRWDFGDVNELKADPDAKNYLYTNREVPFHWDGAFVGVDLRYIFFHCDVAPADGAGGETLFCDSTLLLKYASADQVVKWREIDITYSTEKIAHYGGSFTSPLVTDHSRTGSQILRFAEPVNDLNPVALQVSGVDPSSVEEFLNDMSRSLRDERVCYAHKWQDGDILVADNSVLLHGRREFASNTGRLIRRVNII